MSFKIPDLNEVTSVVNDDLLLLHRASASPDTDKKIKTQNFLAGATSSYSFNDLTAAAIAHALPTAVGAIGDVAVEWENGVISTRELTFTTVSGQTINGISAAVWKGQGNGIIILTSDGSNWRVKEYEDSNRVVGDLTGGYWKKYRDGTQIIEHIGTTTYTTSSAGGVLYISNPVTTFTYPLAFISFDHAVFLSAEVVGLSWGVDRSATAAVTKTTHIAMRLVGVTNAETGKLGYRAKGKWTNLLVA